MANDAHSISPVEITAELFKPFGDLLQLKDTADMLINQDMCERHHNLADIDFEDGGKTGISLFNAKPRSLPYKLEMMERHPKGSQAFIPMYEQPFLVIVAEDNGGVPDIPVAFLTQVHMGINFHKNTSSFWRLKRSVGEIINQGSIQVLRANAFSRVYSLFGIKTLLSCFFSRLLLSKKLTLAL